MSTGQEYLKAHDALKSLAEKRKRWVASNIENEFDEGIKTLLTELYPENAHFIFELLQNAEDKLANEVKFLLQHDRLVVEHNGPQLFSLNDIEAITSIGKSPKRNDTTKIGKFGVGFKSVFAYTNTPEIHSGHFHFRIQDLVVPSTDEVLQSPHEQTTRFVFPFNNDRKLASDAAKEIELALIELADTTVLFLTHIHTLRYQLPDGSCGFIQRIPGNEGMVAIKKQLPGSVSIVSSHWLRFDKTISLFDEEDANSAKQCPIAIAYKLEQRESQGKEPQQEFAFAGFSKWRIVPVSSGQVSIYFPAVKEDSRLRFCMHAPFASTVARDSVRQCNANITLRDHLAVLAAESLSIIRDIGLLTTEFLAVLPLSSDSLSAFYEPFLKSICNAFQNHPLTPTLCGKFKRASILRKGVNDVTSIISDSDLAFLTDYEYLRWAANPRQRNQREDRFLTSLGIEELTFKDLRLKATQKVLQRAAVWLKQKDDAWITSLFSRLSKVQKNSEARLAAETYPIVRLADGGQVQLLKNGVPTAYLPSEQAASGTYRFVSRCVIADNDAKDFLVSLGYSEPDLVAEVIDHVLPLYREALRPSVSDHARHVSMIREAYSTDSNAKKQRLEILLKQTRFIKCKNVVDGAERFELPTKAYIETDELSKYFCGNKEIGFVVTCYTDEEINFLRKLGITDFPRRVQCDYGDPPVQERSTRDPRIENWEIDGLEWFLSEICTEGDAQIRLKKSECLCRMLSAQLEKYPNCFAAKRHYFFFSPKTQSYDSLFVIRLKQTPWLATTDGRCLRPHEVSRDLLTEEILHCEPLLEKLGVQPAAAQRLADQQDVARASAGILGIDLDQAEFVRTHMDEFEQWRRMLELRDENSIAIATAVSKTCERRRQKLHERQQHAPLRLSAPSLRSVPAYSSNEIDPRSLYTFYRNDEDGRLFCQICLHLMPFQKRDGEDYSECVSILTKPWADSRTVVLKVLTPLNLILCPACSCFYREYVHKDFLNQDAIYEALKNGPGLELSIRSSRVNERESDRTVHFDPTHFDDIHFCLESCNA